MNESHAQFFRELRELLIKYDVAITPGPKESKVQHLEICIGEADVYKEIVLYSDRFHLLHIHSKIWHTIDDTPQKDGEE